MSQPVFVIAHQREHAFEWAKNQGIRSNRLRYVTRPEQLRGIRDVTVHILPGAWQRNNCDELLEALQVREATGRVFVIRENKVAA